MINVIKYNKQIKNDKIIEEAGGPSATGRRPLGSPSATGHMPSGRLSIASKREIDRREKEIKEKRKQKFFYKIYLLKIVVVVRHANS